MKKRRKITKVPLVKYKSPKLSFQSVFILLILVVGAIIGLNLITGGKFNLFGQAYNRWPFTNTGTPPNVMLEKDTLKVITYDDTNVLSISGNIVFESIKNTGAECWIVWATLEPDGKRIGSTFPLDSNELYPPKEKCPEIAIGKFVAGSGYPARAERILEDPLPHQNEGILKNANATPYRNFIVNVPVPKNICKLYLHYRSNRQGGNKSKETVFYEVRLHTNGCVTPTPTNITLTTPTPTLVASPETCEIIKEFTNPIGDNYSTCQEFCGSSSKRRGYCRAGLANPEKTETGDWFCCSSVRCNTRCTNKSDCTSGLECIAGRCSDTQNCDVNGSCQCKADKIGKICEYYSECEDLVGSGALDGSCYADTQCSYQTPDSSTNTYFSSD